jgi:hypothetical protein
VVVVGIGRDSSVGVGVLVTGVMFDRALGSFAMSMIATVGSTVGGAVGVGIG